METNCMSNVSGHMKFFKQDLSLKQDSSRDVCSMISETRILAAFDEALERMNLLSLISETEIGDLLHPIYTLFAQKTTCTAHESPDSRQSFHSDRISGRSINVFKNDEQKQKLFRDLLANKEFLIPTTSAGLGSSNRQEMRSDSKVSIVETLKKSFKSRYSSHVHKAIKDNDLTSLMCILAIVANSDAEDFQSLVLTSEPESFSDQCKYSYDSEYEDDTLSETQSELNCFDSQTSSSHYCQKHQVLVGTTISVHTQRVKSLSQQMGDVESLIKPCTDHFTKFFQAFKESLMLKNRVLQRQPESTAPIFIFIKSFMEFRNKVKHALNQIKNHIRNENVDNSNKRISITNSEERRNFEYTPELESLSFDAQRQITQKMEDKLTELREHDKAQLQELVKSYNKGLNEEQCELEKRLEEKKDELGEAYNKLVDTIIICTQGYKSLREFREDLDSKLAKIKHEYNKSMREKQQALKQLQKKLEENCKELERLEAIHAEVEERYDEMRTAKRLREILKSVQMAEEVKENWAARRIQEAWRRYKVRKLRKRKIKKKKKGKKEDSSRANQETTGSRKTSKK